MNPGSCRGLLGTYPRPPNHQSKPIRGKLTIGAGWLRSCPWWQRLHCASAAVGPWRRPRRRLLVFAAPVCRFHGGVFRGIQKENQPFFRVPIFEKHPDRFLKQNPLSIGARSFPFEPQFQADKIDLACVQLQCDSCKSGKPLPLTQPRRSACYSDLRMSCLQGPMFKLSFLLFCFSGWW